MQYIFEIAHRICSLSPISNKEISIEYNSAVKHVLPLALRLLTKKMRMKHTHKSRIRILKKCKGKFDMSICWNTKRTYQKTLTVTLQVFIDLVLSLYLIP